MVNCRLNKLRNTFVNMPRRYKIQAKDLSKELTFSASQSSGPGGQHVNKVNTKVTLRFDVFNSRLLNTEQKATILKRLKSKINNKGIFILFDQSTRSQIKNKEAVVQKMDRLLTKAFAKRKARKSTKPTKTAIRKRLDNKKKQSEKKKLRRKI